MIHPDNQNVLLTNVAQLPAVTLGGAVAITCDPSGPLDNPLTHWTTGLSYHSLDHWIILSLTGPLDYPITHWTTALSYHSLDHWTILSLTGPLDYPITHWTTALSYHSLDHWTILSLTGPLDYPITHWTTGLSYHSLRLFRLLEEKLANAQQGGSVFQLAKDVSKQTQRAGNVSDKTPRSEEVRSTEAR